MAHRCVRARLSPRAAWLLSVTAQASLKFWPFVHLVTFSPLVPLELKPLWVDAVEVVWVAILSRVNAREHEPGPVGENAQAERARA